MKALVTGGAGFIGSNIVEHLLRENHEVVVLDNLLSGYRENLIEGVPFIEGDIRDEDTLLKAAKGVEVIFHLAASVGNKRGIDHPIDDSEINVIGTLRVLEAARKVGARKVVFSSSAGVFGELKTLPIREDHPVEPDSPYGASKLAAEKMCLAYHKLYGLEAACLRYFNVYGVRQRFDAYGNVIPIFAHRIFNDSPILIYGDGEQTRDFVNVRDIVQANYKAALSHSSGAFNIGSATSITINDLVHKMRDLSGRDVVIDYAAPRPGDVRDSLADISAANEAFGYQPVAEFDQGLAEYLAWAEKVLVKPRELQAA